MLSWVRRLLGLWNVGRPAPSAAESVGAAGSGLEESVGAAGPGAAEPVGAEGSGAAGSERGAAADLAGRSVRVYLQKHRLGIQLTGLEGVDVSGIQSPPQELWFMNSAN